MMKSISQYTEDNILVLPEALLSIKDASLLYQQGSNAFFYKDLYLVEALLALIGVLKPFIIYTQTVASK